MPNVCIDSVTKWNPRRRSRAMFPGVESSAMSRVPPEIFDLPSAVRVEIAQELWESVIEHPETLSLTAAQKNELERRWRAFEQNPDDGKPWEELKKSILNE